MYRSILPSVWSSWWMQNVQALPSGSAPGSWPFSNKLVHAIVELLEVGCCIRSRPSCRPLVVDGSLELRLAGRPTAPSWSQKLTSFCRVSSDVLLSVNGEPIRFLCALGSHCYAQKKDIQATPVLKEPPKSRETLLCYERAYQ
jgi:hypothetical protein